MKLVSITLLRNEADIVETFVRYHCSILDHMVIIDHESTDATRSILEKLQEEGLPITLQDTTVFAHAQGELLTQALHDTALRMNPEWIIALDADEFLYTEHVETVRDLFMHADTDTVLKLRSLLYVPLPTDNKNEAKIFKRVTHRCAPSSHAGTVCVPRLFATDTHVELTQGNHNVLYKGSRGTEELPSNFSSDLCIAHFPYRTPQQTAQKILSGYPRHIAKYGKNTEHAIHWKKIHEELVTGKQMQYEDLTELAFAYPDTRTELTLAPFPYSTTDRYTKDIVPDSTLLLAQELSRAAEEIHAAHTALGKLKTEASQLQSGLHAMRTSKSWQWTEPIRKMEKWLRERLNQKSVRTNTCIIIPVHNAYEEVKSCLWSVLLCTDFSETQVIIIDDASTDERIAVLLAELRSLYPELITVLRNHTQMGFVRSVNRGIAHAGDAHVILLNSDCIVSPGWNAELMRVAERAGDCASVTALSNNASIYSVAREAFPTVPTLQDIACVSASVRAKISIQSIRIPTGVGFCMLLRRDALREIGDLDEIFGMGYGEENDWCMRAREKGWRHYIALHCFVYHKGGVSMQAAGIVNTKQQTLQAHEHILQKRYPQYTTHIKNFLRWNRAFHKMQSRLVGVRAVAPSRPLIAYVIHADIESKHAGGTEIHTRTLIAEIRKSNDCAVLCPREHALDVLFYTEHDQTRFQIPYGASGILGAYSRFFEIFETCTLVHIQHLLGSPIHLIELCKALGKTVIYSIHDSYLTHREPQPLLHTAEGKHLLRTQQERTELSSLIRLCDHIIAPSTTALENVLTYYPDVRVPTSVIAHAIQAVPHGVHTPHRKKVCFLGRTHAEQKGKSLVVAVTHLLRKQGIDVVFLGSSWRDFPSLTLRKGISLRGAYTPEHVIEKLQNTHANVVCIFSLFPETYSLALDEAWTAGIPTYVTPIGALPERIAHTRAGKVAPSFDPEEIAIDLLQYIESDELLEHRKNAGAFIPRSTRDMANAYREIYDDTLKKQQPEHVPGALQPAYGRYDHTGVRVA